MRRQGRRTPLIAGTRGWLAVLLLVMQIGFLGIGVRPVEAAGPNAIVSDAGCVANSIGRTDDGVSGQIPMGFSVNFFGANYSALYVNNNGNATFGRAYSGFSGLNLAAFGSPIMAVAFYDVDTRPSATTPVSYGPITFAGHPAYCVNWVNVGYYSGGTDRLNSSQLVLVDRSETGAGNFDIVMNYDVLSYEPGGGLTAGYSSGSSTFVYPGSGIAGSLIDSNASTGLVHHSGGSSQLGRYVYQVRGGQPTPPGGQSIDFPATGDLTYGAAPFVVSPTAGSGLPVTVTASGACTVADFTVSITAVGTCTLTATQSGNGDYTAAAAVTRTFHVNRASTAVTIAGLDQTYDGSPHPVVVSADPDPGNGSITVTYSGSSAPPTDAGSYPVVAVYDSPTHTGTSTARLVVARATQEITFAELPTRTFGNDPIGLAASSSSGLPVSYVATGTCALDGVTLTVTGTGRCTVTATQDGDANHAPATPVPRSFAVARGAARIVLTGLSQTYRGVADPVAVAVDPADAGVVTVTYDGSDTPPTDAGSYQVVASVDGPNYAGTLTATLVIAKAAQEVSFAELDGATYGDAPREVHGTASSGLPVRLTATGSCALRAGSLGFTSGGHCAVTAYQNGDANWLAAPDVMRSVVVARATQALTLTGPDALRVDTAPGVVRAGSTANLRVHLNASGPCVLAVVGQDAVVAPLHAGSCEVTASQAGDAMYLPAAEVSFTTIVLRGDAVLTVGELSQIADGHPRPVRIRTTPAELPGVNVTYDTSASAPKAPGTFRVVVTLDNPDYDAVPLVATLTVAQPAAVPVPDPTTGSRPTLPPSQGLSTVNGNASPVTVTPAVSGGLTLAGAGFTAAVAALNTDDSRVPLDAQGNLVLDRKRQVLVTMTGFAASTRVDVWLFSDPVLIGQVTTDGNGSVLAHLPVPATLPVGEHALQINGITAEGEQRSLSVGVMLLDAVVPPPVTTPPVQHSQPATPPVQPRVQPPVSVTQPAVPGAQPSGIQPIDPGTQQAGPGTPPSGPGADPSGPGAQQAGPGTRNTRPPAAMPGKPDRVDALAALPVFVPAEHAKAVVNTAVAAFTLLAVTAGAGSLALGGAGAPGGTSGGGGGRSRRKAGKISSGAVKHFKESWDGTGPGDRSRTWRLAPTGWLDRRSLAVPQRIAPYSPLVARVLTDGSYLRAMLGAVSLALPAAGVVLGALAAVDTNGTALPPHAGLMLALVVVGVFDAVAGFAAAVTFAALVAAMGGIGSADSVRLMLGVCSLWFAIALLAGVVRPFRRPVPECALDWWTRAGDVLIASLVGGWAVQKTVGALPGLAGHELPIAGSANRIAVAVIAAIAGRIALESIAVWAYPNRLFEVRPEKLPKSGRAQQLAAIAIRTALFVFVAFSFLGAPWQLWAGTVLFVVPQVVGLFEDSFPNHPKLFRVLPKRLVKTVLMMFVGTAAGVALAWLIHDPGRRIVNGFVLLSIPGILVSFIELFGRDGEAREQSWPRELAGFAVLVIGIAAALGFIG